MSLTDEYDGPITEKINQLEADLATEKQHLQDFIDNQWNPLIWKLSKLVQDTYEGEDADELVEKIKAKLDAREQE